MKKSPIIVVLVAVPFVLGFPDASPACSFGPELFELAGRAEAIVLARIETVDDPSKPEEEEWDESADHFEQDIIVLRVLETWKGPAMAEVRVHVYDASAYKVGGVMLAFLDRGETVAAAMNKSLDEWNSDDPVQRTQREELREKNRRYAAWSAGRWFIAGNVSTAVLFPRDQDRTALKDLVLAAAQLQSGGTVDPRDRRDWFVSAAERKFTRYEGLMQLRWDLAPLPTPPFEGELEDPEPEAEEAEVEGAVESAPEPLTKDQLERLAAGFVREPAVDESDASMLRLLASYPDLEVDRTAASLVEAGLLLRPIPSWVTEMVELTLARYGDVFADRIGRDDVDKEGRPIYTGEGENTLPTIWEVARRELGIPSVAPAQPPPE